MGARRALAMLALAAALWGTSTAPADAQDMGAWEATAGRFMAMLPDPLPGWTRTEPRTFVVDSAFQKVMQGQAVYRPEERGRGTQVAIFIGARPDREPSWLAPLAADAEAAARRDYAHVTVDGRLFLRSEKAENITYVTLLERGVTVTFAAKWTEDETVRRWLATVDYDAVARIE